MRQTSTLTTEDTEDTELCSLAPAFDHVLTKAGSGPMQVSVRGLVFISLLV